MTTQEIWQLQALQAPRVSAAYVQHRALELARGARTRKFSDYGILVMVALLLAWRAWSQFPHRPILLAGLTLTMLTCIYGAIRKHRLASVARVPEDAGALDSLSFYRRELERLRDARRARWWLPLVVPGLITMLASFMLEFNPIPWARVAFAATVIVGALALGVAKAEWGARRLQREIDALDSLVVKNPAR